MAFNAEGIISPVAHGPFRMKSALKTENPTHWPGTSIFRAVFMFFGLLLGAGFRRAASVITLTNSEDNPELFSQRFNDLKSQGVTYHPPEPPTALAGLPWSSDPALSFAAGSHSVECSEQASVPRL